MPSLEGSHRHRRRPAFAEAYVAGRPLLGLVALGLVAAAACSASSDSRASDVDFTQRPLPPLVLDPRP